MPIPFTQEAVTYLSDRIKRVQDILERRIAVENISYYAAPGQEIAETDFINAILQEADCDLLLDVNNIIVNSINHQYDAEKFLYSMPKERVVYFHVAGHYVEAEDLRVDTHGSDVSTEVWALLDKAYDHFGAVPTLLERDFNIPPLPVLMQEVDRCEECKQIDPLKSYKLRKSLTCLNKISKTSNMRLPSTYVTLITLLGSTTLKIDV